ncbi:replicative DNA helicase [Zoogloea sp.]|uniref:replicative DNA helicase n=1 Tax=Zoogloea sp. TaxID=49181 RepID=UPI001AC280CE|nr:replicative DNA helicase [Zoogloea sp.]MBN8283752.1 replicative DNA helicase [Zoogloea sp.]
MNAPDLRNLPPHSLEAEQGLLGAVLVDGARVLDRIEGTVTAADFYRADHQTIFATAKALHDAGKAVDLLTVLDALEARGEADRAGGLGYLGELGNGGFLAANARSYAGTIRERATLRGLQQTAADILAACSMPAGRSPADIAAQAEASMQALVDHSDTEPARLQDVLCDVLGDVQERMERGGRIAGLSTGFGGFDGMTGGLEPGQLVIVAARPSVGKTVVGCNIAAHVATGGSPVLFVTLEMTRREIAARILAARSGVTVQAMRAGTSERNDWDRMNTAVASSASWKLFIDDTPAVSVAYVRAKARSIQRTHGLGLVVIDYLGLMRGTGDNRAQEVGSISRGLKALAKQLQVPVVALAQLNRASEGRLDRKPTLADLRDSGEIEQDADIVAMLHRESMHREAPEWEGLAQLLIRKNRNGPTGECLLALDGPRMRFTDYHGPCPVAARPEKPAQRKGFEA